MVKSKTKNKKSNFIEKINKRRFLKANKKYLCFLIIFIAIIIIFDFLVVDKVEYILNIIMSLLCGVLASAIVLWSDKKNRKISQNIINKKLIINKKYEQYEKILVVFNKIQSLPQNANFNSIFKEFGFRMYDLTVTGNILDSFKSKDDENKYSELRRSMCKGFGRIYDMSSLKLYVDANLENLEKIQNLLSAEFFNCIDDKLVQEKDLLQ